MVWGLLLYNELYSVIKRIQKTYNIYRLDCVERVHYNWIRVTIVIVLIMVTVKGLEG